MNLALHSYHNLDELNDLRPAWDVLLAQYPVSTTFSTWEWLTCWWRAFGHGAQMLVLAMYDSGSLVGLAPLSISKEKMGWFSLHVLRLMGDGSGDSDNLDFPVRPGFEDAFAKLILQYLQQRKMLWDVCLLNTLPPDSLVGRCIVGIVPSFGWPVFEHASTCSAVSLPDSWESYTQTLSSEDRGNLARYTRRLQARYRMRIYRCTEPDELQPALEALFQLHQERWHSAGQPGSFSSAPRRAFYGELSEYLLARGCLELWVMELDGTIAAVQFAFRHGGRVFQLQEGYDCKRPSDRVGYVLRGAVLKHLISGKVRSYDFLGGDDSYKSRWGAVEGHYCQIHFARPHGIGELWLQSVEKAAHSKNWLRRKLPSPAWRVLNRIKMKLAPGGALLERGIRP